MSAIPFPRRASRRLGAVVGAGLLGVALVLGPTSLTATPVGASGERGPVDDALSAPAALDSLADVAALADETSGLPGVRVGVVTDRNGDRPGGIEVERIQSPAEDVGALTARLDTVTGVVAATEDRPVAVAAADPLAPSQYGPSRIRADQLEPGLDGRGTTVAVIDTGVAASHPDLSPALPDGRPRVATGTTFLWNDSSNGGPGTTDPHGHGTHVAGIVAAARGNGIGGAGVAPGAQILPVRVLGPTGIGWSSDVTAGILWAHQQGADVVNLSLGATGNVPADIDGAINQVTTDRSRGKPPTVVVAAAGNSGPSGAASWPGRHPRAIAVGATDASDAIAPYSTWGGYVSVSAPGSAVLSTCRTGDYCHMWGTSMATPMVAGAAAVLRQKMPAYGPDEVRNRLESTAVDRGAPGRDPAHGAGRIDVLAAAGSPPPAPGPAAVPLSGSIDRAVVDRRRWEVAGTAVDPDATPVIRIIDSLRGRWQVTDVAGSGGRWSVVGENAAPGTHTVCAVGIDQPSGQGVLLGCRQLVIK